MRWLRSLVVASVLGAGLFFASSDSADARPRYGRGHWGPGYSNYRGYYGGGWGGYYGSGYYGGGYYPRYYSNYYGYPGWGYSSPEFYFYYR